MRCGCAGSGSTPDPAVGACSTQCHAAGLSAGQRERAAAARGDGEAEPPVKLRRPGDRLHRPLRRALALICQRREPRGVLRETPPRPPVPIAPLRFRMGPSPWSHGHRGPSRAARPARRRGTRSPLGLGGRHGAGAAQQHGCERQLGQQPRRRGRSAATRPPACHSAAHALQPHPTVPLCNRTTVQASTVPRRCSRAGFSVPSAGARAEAGGSR